MKKYLNICVAVLLSSLTFSLVSCSKDDDNPSGSNKSVVLTIDSKEYVFNYLMSGNDPYDDDVWSCFLSNLSSKDDYELMIYIGGWNSLSNGTVWTNQSDYFIMFNWDNAPTSILGSYLKSGSVKVDKIDKNNITLTFDNAVYGEGYSSATVTVNGTITLPVDDIWM